MKKSNPFIKTPPNNKMIQVEDLSHEGLHLVYVVGDSLILSPNDQKQRSIELFNNWLKETYEK